MFSSKLFSKSAVGFVWKQAVRQLANARSIIGYLFFGVGGALAYADWSLEFGPRVIASDSSGPGGGACLSADFYSGGVDVGLRPIFLVW